MTRNSLFILAGLSAAIGSVGDILLPTHSHITQDSASFLSERDQRRRNQINASRSQRQMRIDRGHNPDAIGARRIYRNKQKAIKAANRYCNNIGPDSEFVYK